MLAIDAPNGTPVSKKITVKAFFGAVPANTVFNANVTVTGNKFRSAANAVFTKTITTNNVIWTLGSVPATNNAATESKSTGQAWFSNTYLYIAVNATTIKRVALSTF